MRLINWLDPLLTLSGDTESVRMKKKAAWLAGVAGLVLTAMIGVINLVAGLDLIAILHFVLAAVMILIVLVLTYAPQHYFILVFVTSAIVTVFPWLTHVAAGGYTAGVATITFILFGPISALLLIGPRPALVDLGLLVICAVVATLLEPWAARNMLEVNPSLRQMIGLFNAVSGSLLIFLLTLFIYREAEQAQMRSDSLLLNILPASIAARLKRDQGIIAERYPDVTVLFADIVDFTPMSAQSDPTEIVGLLNEIFSDFDDLADKYGLEKIKTIGDAYMIAGGLPEPRPDHTEAVAAFALEIVKVIKRHRGLNGESICVRVGINTGPVVAGVIGHRKFIYDLWGDAVNIASRMESHGLENCIQVTQAVRDRLDGLYEFEERGLVNVKGKGEMITYLMKMPEVTD